MKMERHLHFSGANVILLRAVISIAKTVLVTTLKSLSLFTKITVDTYLAPVLLSFPLWLVSQACLLQFVSTQAPDIIQPVWPVAHSSLVGCFLDCFSHKDLFRAKAENEITPAWMPVMQDCGHYTQDGVIFCSSSLQQRQVKRLTDLPLLFFTLWQRPPKLLICSFYWTALHWSCTSANLFETFFSADASFRCLPQSIFFIVLTTQLTKTLL